MSARAMLVAGNWKMMGSKALAQRFVDAFAGWSAPDGVSVLVLPPATLIETLRDGGFEVGAQNLHAEAEGAYTGELSGDMLREAGATWVLVGHSERRQYAGESDSVVAAKFRRARSVGLRPIVCVGETLDERERGDQDAVVARQIDAVLDAADVRSLPELVIGYEPVWAIGTGRTATPEIAQAMHAVIRRQVGARDKAAAQRVQILYGGSVKPDNAVALFAGPDVDGGLVGGAALEPESFLAIIDAAARTVAG